MPCPNANSSARLQKLKFSELAECNATKSKLLEISRRSAKKGPVLFYKSACLRLSLINPSMPITVLHKANNIKHTLISDIAVSHGQTNKALALTWLLRSNMISPYIGPATLPHLTAFDSSLQI